MENDITKRSEKRLFHTTYENDVRIKIDEDTGKKVYVDEFGNTLFKPQINNNNTSEKKSGKGGVVSWRDNKGSVASTPGGTTDTSSSNENNTAVESADVRKSHLNAAIVQFLLLTILTSILSLCRNILFT